jgi:plastocyanin
MSRIALATAALATSLVAAIAVASATGSAGLDRSTSAKPIGTINGSVGPGFTITVSSKPKKGGTYKLVVSDKSCIHNFDLVGTKAVTSVSGTGTKTFTVALKAGKTYTFYCDPHRTTMVGKFTVPKK